MTTQLSSHPLHKILSRDDILTAHEVLLESSRTVQDIIDELCERDPRFQVIQESISQFHMGDDQDGLLRSSFDVLKYGGDSDTSFELLRSIFDVLEYGGGYDTPLRALNSEEIWQKQKAAIQVLIDIIHASIYEILEAFSMDVATHQIPALPSFDDFVRLLKNLYAISKNRPVRPVSFPQSNEQSNTSQETYTYRYIHSLGRLSKQTHSQKIRVLHLLPGSGRSRIVCRLEVRDLRDGIDEALSYVWGKRQDPKCIWVDDQIFQITGNLYEILITLRHPSTLRTMWIDAICINQSDLEEKSHQVRLMGEIYSNAKTTTIWLSGQSPGLNLTPDPYDPMAPLPSNLGREVVDQYDVVSIIKWTDQLLKINVLERDHPVAWLLLTHWVNVIMSHEWWERVWTIQEAVLPKNHPKIILGTHEFSFGDIISAMNMLKRLQKIQPNERLESFDTGKGPLSPDNEFLVRALKTHCSHYKRLNYTRLLPYLRPGHDDNRFQTLATPTWRNLDLIICTTSHYKATDPRDKYFALQALLRNSRGKFMYTNYRESPEDVFRRATARCYNSSPRLEITVTFDLFVETPHANTTSASIPSWVLDFTYSDVHHHTSKHGDEVTFKGYMRDEETWNPRYNPGAGINRCFATPKTLFCPGLSIDSILTMGLIPDLGDNTDWVDKLASFLTSLTSQHGRSYWAKEAWKRYQSGGYGWDPTLTGRQHDTTQDNLDAASLSDTTVSIGSDQGQMPSIVDPDSTEQRNGKVRQSEGPIPRIIKDLDLPTTDMVNLFTLGGERSLESEISSNLTLNSRGRQMQRRVSGLAGKHFFTTDKGLVGISTAPVMAGDTLAVMDASPAYYIFREVKASNGRSYLAQRHRIVARAVLSEDKDKMKKRFVGLQHKMFQIV